MIDESLKLLYLFLLKTKGNIKTKTDMEIYRDVAICCTTSISFYTIDKSQKLVEFLLKMGIIKYPIRFDDFPKEIFERQIKQTRPSFRRHK